MKTSILRPSHNCLSIRKVDKLALLFDASNYYRAFFDVAKQARTSILLAGWDVDSRIGLGHIERGFPDSLRKYFNSLVEANPKLRVNIQSWRPMAYLRFGRERFAQWKWRKSSADNISYILDQTDFAFCSFHEKLCIIDSSCAFIGGMDLTKNRWDTPGHNPHDVLRVNKGRPYHPVHDLQAVLSGELTKELIQLYMRRMKNFDNLPEELSTEYIWPSDYPSQLEDVKVAVARTDVASNCFEIEKLYVDAIIKAQKFILIENQYLSHQEITDQLCRRLAEEKGPQVIILGPLTYRGLFEKSVFISKRNKIIHQLRQADKYKRLAIMYPHFPSNDAGNFIVVHTKLMAIDFSFLTLGSANLNHRSMKVDYEMNIALEAEDGDKSEKIKEFIKSNIFRLLSEHLSLADEEFEQHFNKSHSLLDSINYFQGKYQKTLVDMPFGKLNIAQKLLTIASPFVDIKYPVLKKFSWDSRYAYLRTLFSLKKVKRGYK